MGPKGQHIFLFCTAHTTCRQCNVNCANHANQCNFLQNINNAGGGPSGVAGKADAPQHGFPLQHALGRSVVAQGALHPGFRRPLQSGKSPTLSPILFRDVTYRCSKRFGDVFFFLSWPKGRRTLGSGDSFNQARLRVGI